MLSVNKEIVKYLLCALSTNGGEYTSGAFLWVCGVNGEVGASDNAHLDLRIDDKREADGVLLAS